ncbi:MAG: winged helix-turn-helix domain-containing protein [Armatimonadota bacterium]
MSAPKILIVEDEAPIAEGLAYNLRREGMEVIIASDGEKGFELARSANPDLIILDLMLPGVNGVDLCRMLRRESDVPIIMLTVRNAEIDRVVGLTVGADDYVTKPFSVPELIARIRAVLRRASTSSRDEPSSKVAIGHLAVDFDARRVTVDGKPVALTPKEYDLLRVLLKNRGRVLTRDMLLEQVWSGEQYIDPRTVDVHIRWLRQKIEKDPSNPTLIQTVRGVGYRFGD